MTHHHPPNKIGESVKLHEEQPTFSQFAITAFCRNQTEVIVDIPPITMLKLLLPWQIYRLGFLQSHSFATFLVGMHFMGKHVFSLQAAQSGVRVIDPLMDSENPFASY